MSCSYCQNPQSDKVCIPRSVQFSKQYAEKIAEGWMTWDVTKSCWVMIRR